MYKYNIILSNSDQNKDKELRLINAMLEKQVDGILFMGGDISEEHVEQFQSSSVPVVLAATYDETDKIPSVNIDYEAAAFEATSYLIEKGNTRIAFISGVDDTLINKQKYNGYVRAHEEKSVTLDDAYILKGDYSYDSGLEAAEQLLAKDEQPSSVFVASDEMALGVIHGAQDRGFRVPEDLEVFGFDNTRLATMVRPTLSTIVQPMYDIGAVAMRLLTKYMNKEEVEEKKSFFRIGLSKETQQTDQYADIRSNLSHRFQQGSGERDNAKNRYTDTNRHYTWVYYDNASNPFQGRNGRSLFLFGCCFYFCGYRRIDCITPD